jgi:hypothetical protein
VSTTLADVVGFDSVGSGLYNITVAKLTTVTKIIATAKVKRK